MFKNRVTNEPLGFWIYPPKYGSFLTFFRGYFVKKLGKIQDKSIRHHFSSNFEY